MIDKEQKLRNEIKALKELLKETMKAMCDWRTIKGKCSECKNKYLCLARKTIPKVEKVLNVNKTKINKEEQILEEKDVLDLKGDIKDE